MTDLLSNMLNEIKKGQRCRCSVIICMKSKLNIMILLKLIQEGLIYSFVNYNSYHLKVWLKYNQFGEPLITNLCRVSKVSCRRFLKVNELKRLTKATDNKLFLLTTTQGIVTNKEAIKKRLGGEVLVQIN